MPTPTVITDLDPVAANNFPAGSNAPAVLDDVQRAHAAFIRQLLNATQSNAYTAVTAGGTSTAVTLTPSPAITAYAAGQSFWVTFPTALGASPTLNINGLGATLNGVKQNADGTYSNVAANDIPANHRGAVTLLSATQALVELPAAKSGANSDITSLGGLTTPLSAAQGGTGNALGGNSEPTAIFRDVKAKNTHGGGSSAGDNTRALNSTQYNNITGCSLNTGTGVITLPAGTYEIEASAPCYRGDDHQVFLYNNTDASVAIAGTSELSLAGQSTSTQSFLDGVITIAAQKDFTLRHFILTAIAANGLGVAANSTTINAEVYSVVKIKKRFA